MKKAIKRFIPIFKKEFLHLIRDPRTLLMVLVIPVMELVLFGYAVSFDVKNVPVALFDQDKTASSREFTDKFIRSGYFDLVGEVASENQYADWLDSGRARAVFNIPSGFAQNVASGKKAEVQIIVDGSDPTTAASVLSYLNSISQEYFKTLILKMTRHEMKDPIKVEHRVWYNENLRSLNFFIPGLICLILMLMSASLTALSIVSEKENGSMEGLVVSPVRKGELMLGKILPYVVIALMDVFLICSVGYFWFGVPIKGSLALLFVSSFVFLIGAMGIGIFISTNAQTSQEAMMVAIIATMLPTMLLSGFIFPIENMPWLLQAISYFIPARYFLIILRGIFLKGIGLNYLWSELLMLAIFSCVVIILSDLKFKKRIE